MASEVTWQSHPPETLLRERFRIRTGFHPGQRDIIEQLVQGKQGKRLLVIQRTGPHYRLLPIEGIDARPVPTLQRCLRDTRLHRQFGLFARREQGGAGGGYSGSLQDTLHFPRAPG